MSYTDVASAIRARAAEAPDRIALVFADGRGGWDTWTYAELDQRTSRYARGFAGQGIRRGDRALFLVKPSLEFYAMLIALLEVGAIPTVIDPGMGLRKVLECIGQISPRAIVALSVVHAVKAFVRAPFRSVEVSITYGRRWFWGGATTEACLDADLSPFPIPAFSPEDEAFIVFTSGSTGTPKGVSFRHGMFTGATRLMESQLGLVAGQVVLETFAPFVVFHLAIGETVVVPEMDLSKPMKADPAKIVNAIQRWRPAVAFASPAVLRKIVPYCTERKIVLDSLRTVLTGVAPIPGWFHEGFRSILAPGGQVVVNYGATEALTCCTVSTDEVLGETWARTAKGEGNCVGRPFPEVEVRIVRISDGPMPVWDEADRLPSGTIGEVVVKGPIVSPEYKDRPDANAISKVRDADGAWMHRTGDLGWLDAEGRLWFCGRKSHRIETATGVVPNGPLEGIFGEHPAVARAAVVGVGPAGARVPVLVVEPKPGVQLDEATTRAVLALADGTRWAGAVTRLLVHPSFPMDTRHNSKIRNEDLTAWAEKQTAVGSRT